ncbi:FISUMP domain-containing protein [Proteiniphilum sp.]|uniref:FISUMP domain-containing protein n=1 Tax=Proteiniphilum sp. TaxID=1926877 RepID=UPI003326C5EF
MKTNLSPIIFIALSLVLFYGCKKEYALIDDVSLDKMNLPNVETVSVNDITQNSAQIISVIHNNGGGRVKVSGICWSSTTQVPTIEDSKTMNGFSEGEYRTLLTNLDIASSYYVRSYATNLKGTAYGEVIHFTTTAPLAILAPPVITDITSTSAIVSGSIIQYEETVTTKGFCWNIEGNPTIEDFKVECTEESQEFSCVLQDLEAGIVYTVRAYAINSGGVAYSNPINFKTGAPTIKDVDGNEYTTVKIGNQTWMVENLKVTHYRNGDPIERVTLASEWNVEVGKYGIYQNNDLVADVVGNLYNWYALADPRNIAPEGWRVPTEEDWTILVNYLGGDAVAGGKLKSTDPSHWADPNEGATNSSGFTAVGGGVAGTGTIGGNLTIQGIYWCSTEHNPTTGLIRIIEHNHTQAIYSGGAKKGGYSVRLIKDE